MQLRRQDSVEKGAARPDRLYRFARKMILAENLRERSAGLCWLWSVYTDPHANETYGSWRDSLRLPTEAISQEDARFFEMRRMLLGGPTN